MVRINLNSDQKEARLRTRLRRASLYRLSAEGKDAALEDILYLRKAGLTYINPHAKDRMMEGYMIYPLVTGNKERTANLANSHVFHPLLYIIF